MTGRARYNHRACPGGCGQLDDECTCRRQRATLCGPRGIVAPEQLTDGDRAAIEGFAHFLAGGSACLICMTPDEQCTSDPNKCCPDCKHARPRTPSDPTQGVTTA